MWRRWRVVYSSRGHGPRDVATGGSSGASRSPSCYSSPSGQLPLEGGPHRNLLPVLQNQVIAESVFLVGRSYRPDRVVEELPGGERQGFNRCTKKHLNIHRSLASISCLTAVLRRLLYIRVTYWPDPVLDPGRPVSNPIIGRPRFLSSSVHFFMLSNKSSIFSLISLPPSFALCSSQAFASASARANRAGSLHS